MLVETVLVPPAPVGPRPHVRVGGRRLGQLDELRPNGRAGSVLGGLEVDERLTLLGGPVAVLGEQRLTALCHVGQRHHRIAAKRHAHYSLFRHVYERFAATTRY